MSESAPRRGIYVDAEKILVQLKNQPSFLMVGTLDPRKGHEQVLDAFESLWNGGQEVKLVIVGKQGWMIEPLIERVRNHQELERRLFWLQGISDEYLSEIYAASTCLIAASFGERFGLPLIEAAQHKLPIIARDIPVFREVAGANAHYFQATQPHELAQALEEWWGLYQADKPPRSDGMPWFTWKERAEKLAQILLKSGKR